MALRRNPRMGIGLALVYLSLLASCGSADSPSAVEREPESAASAAAACEGATIETELGTIVVTVDPIRAPVTTANFLRHVDDGLFEGARFYRTVTDDNQPDNPVKIAVIQGGLEADEGPLPPIPHETTEETGLLHVDGALSMARLEPGTATAEFFVCVGDQPDLDFGGRRNPDGQGFAAFGVVLEGMDVVRAIHTSPADGQSLTPPVRILSIRRPEGCGPRGQGTD